MKDFLTLLWPLCLSIVIEYIIVQFLWLYFLDKKEDSIKESESKTKEKAYSKLVFFENMFVLLPVIIVNVLTNPAINIFARYLWRETSISNENVWIIISILEIVVFVVEGVLYKFLLKTKWSIAFVLSFFSNFLSYMSSFLL